MEACERGKETRRCAWLGGKLCDSTVSWKTLTGIYVHQRLTTTVYMTPNKGQRRRPTSAGRGEFQRRGKTLASTQNVRYFHLAPVISLNTKSGATRSCVEIRVWSVHAGSDPNQLFLLQDFHSKFLQLRLCSRICSVEIHDLRLKSKVCIMCFNPLLASVLFHVISKPDSELNPISRVLLFKCCRNHEGFHLWKKKITPLLCTLQRDAH